MKRRLFIVASATALLSQGALAENKCQLQQYGQLPVTMSGTRPQISGTINGQPAVFLLDSGAFYSMLERESSDKFGLHVGPMPGFLTVSGIGGTAQTGVAKAKEFSLAGLMGGRTIKNVDFIVGGNMLGGDVDGLIGQNIIGAADAEYDLANGVIRIFKAEHCSGRNLAYWANGANVAEMDISERNPLESHIIASAKINGKRIRVMFDSGAWRSLLDLDAAKRAGIQLEDDSVQAAEIARGIGKNTVETWVARFDSLDLGGELIKNARLRVGDISARRSDMLLGADFFLSHRIYVASRQNKLYFTYNGGSVFDLRPNRSDRKTITAATSPQKEVNTEQAGSQSSPSAETHVDAAELRRRGAAMLGRQDIAGALAIFDQAVAADGANADNYYQRGLAHLQNRQPQLAMKDFEQSIALKPDFSDALTMRGMINLRRKQEAQARTDFDAAIRASNGEIETIRRISQIYTGAGNYDDAINLLDIWVEGHPKDDRLPVVLNERCMSRALANKDLDKALEDCNWALKKGPKNSAVLDSRAFVYLRMSQWEKSIADYNASLKLQPKRAWSLYGLSLAQSHKGLKSEAEHSLQAALAIDPNVAAPYSRVGLTP